jgi:hypothetical protein
MSATAAKFAQSPEIGATVVVNSLNSCRPILTTISGRGTRDGLPILRYLDDAFWEYPQNVTVIPERAAAMLGEAYESLADIHPVLTEEAKGGVYLAALAAYEDTGDEFEDYETLHDAVLAEAQRLENELGSAPRM